MNVWIFNPFDDVPREGKPQRYWSLASELAAQGHNVVWWSSVFSHRRKCRRDLSGIFESKDFQIRLVECPSYMRNVSFARIVNHWKWHRQLICDAVREVSSGSLIQPDIIFSSMPPLEGPTAGIVLKKHFQCRVVIDVMDAWPKTLLQALPQFYGLESFVGKFLLLPYWWLLNKNLSNCDAVSAQSESFATFARQHGWTRDVEVCYLGAADAQVDKPSISNCGVLHIAYIGAMGRSYDLDTLLRSCIELLKLGRRIKLHIAGEGEQFSALRSAAEDAPDGSIEFYGFLSEQELNELLQACDIGIVPMFAESGVAVPYKVGEYLSAALVVVNSLPGELDDLLQVYSCGYLYEAGSVSSLVSALEFYLDMSSEELCVAKKNAQRLFHKKFNRESIYPTFARWIIAQNDAT